MFAQQMNFTPEVKAEPMRLGGGEGRRGGGDGEAVSGERFVREFVSSGVGTPPRPFPPSAQLLPTSCLDLRTAQNSAIAAASAPCAASKRSHPALSCQAVADLRPHFRAANQQTTLACESRPVVLKCLSCRRFFSSGKSASILRRSITNGSSHFNNQSPVLRNTSTAPDGRSELRRSDIGS